MTDSSDAADERNAFNYGLLQIGSPQDGAYYVGTSSRTDVLRVLLSTFGPSLETFQVVHPTITPWIRQLSMVTWLPTFDARYLSESVGGLGLDEQALILPSWISSTKADIKWESHARFVSYLGRSLLSNVLESAVNTGLPAGGEPPSQVSNGLYPASLAFPPELLPTFRVFARGFLVAVPPHHHMLRRVRDVCSWLCLNSLSWFQDENGKDLVLGDWRLAAAELAAKQAVEGDSFAGGRTQISGNLDCGLAPFAVVEPDDPSKEESTQWFFSANGALAAAKKSVHAVKGREDGGQARRWHAIYGWNMKISTGMQTMSLRPGNDGAIGTQGPPFVYENAEYDEVAKRIEAAPAAFGLMARGIKFAIAAGADTAVHEFGHLWMRRLFQWTYEDEPDLVSGEPPPPGPVAVRERVAFRRMDGSSYADATGSAIVGHHAFHLTFGPERQAVYASGAFPVVLPGDLHLFRILDLAIASAGLGLPVGVPITPSIVSAVRKAVLQDYHGRREGSPSLETEEFAKARKSLSAMYELRSLFGDYVAMAGQHVVPELLPWFCTSTGGMPSSERVELEAKMYEGFATTRPAFWDRVWIAKAIRDVVVSVVSPGEAFFAGCRTNPTTVWTGSDAVKGLTPIKAGGFHAFADHVVGGSAFLLDLSFRTMAAAFSVTFASVTRHGNALFGPVVAVPTPDGCQIASLSAAGLFTTFVTRTGEFANTTTIPSLGAAKRFDLALRKNRGLSVLELKSYSLAVHRLSPDATYFSGLIQLTQPVLTKQPHTDLDLKGIECAQFFRAAIANETWEGDELIVALDESGNLNGLVNLPTGWVTLLQEPRSSYGEVVWFASDVFWASNPVPPGWAESAASASVLSQIARQARAKELTPSAGAGDADNRRLVLAVARISISDPSTLEIALVELPTPGDLWDAAMNRDSGSVYLRFSDFGGLPESLLAGFNPPGTSASARSLRFSIGSTRSGALLVDAAIGLHAPFAVAIQVGADVHIYYGSYGSKVGPYGPSRSQMLLDVTLLDVRVGWSSIQVMCRRGTGDGQHTVVFECLLDPSIRDGREKAVWRKAAEGLIEGDPSELNLLSVLTMGIDGTTPPDPQRERLWLDGADVEEDWLWMEHRLWAEGGGGEHGAVVALPTLDLPPRPGDSVTFIHAVLRDGVLQLGVSSEGGPTGVERNQTVGVDCGRPQSEEQQFADDLTASSHWGPKCSEATAWETNSPLMDVVPLF